MRLALQYYADQLHTENEDIPPLYHHLCPHWKSCKRSVQVYIMLLSYSTHITYSLTLNYQVKEHTWNLLGSFKVKIVAQMKEKGRKVRRWPRRGLRGSWCWRTCCSAIPILSIAPFWLKALELKDTDKDQLLNGEWLTYKHLSAVSKLLEQQCYSCIRVTVGVQK